MADRKIVLAFSGGLDTSVAVPWLKDKYGADIVTLTIDLAWWTWSQYGSGRSRWERPRR